MEKQTKEQLVLRFAPSPTGFIHIGTARTALFNFLLAKQQQGKLLMRIEDTDTERSKPEFEEDILASMQWLGIEFDQIVKQSERTDIYKKNIEKMLEDGSLYISEEKEGQRKEVIRFKNPGGKISFFDQLRGQIEFDVLELGDFVVAKSLTEPLYHLAVVIDDHQMGVNYIIRGEDHISNTPRQILLQQALGATECRYLHLPLILAPDRSKMSKRYGPVSVNQYQKDGYLKEALINYLALLGWNPGTDDEVFSIEELIENFSASKIQKGGAIFNIEKLNWFNKEHLKRKDRESVLKMAFQFLPEEFKNQENFDQPMIEKVINELIDSARIDKLSDITEMAEKGEFDLYLKQPDYPAEKLIWKLTDDDNKTERLERTRSILTELINLLSNIDTDRPSSQEVREVVWPYAEQIGRGDVLWPMRFALSGQDKSPDPFILTDIFGQKESLKRLQFALDKINNAIEK